ncbi:hypothetical protein ABTL82_19760, partial [Acinetobacter baumannii]
MAVTTLSAFPMRAGIARRARGTIGTASATTGATGARRRFGRRFDAHPGLALVPLAPGAAKRIAKAR